MEKELKHSTIVSKKYRDDEYTYEEETNNAFEPNIAELNESELDEKIFENTESNKNNSDKELLENTDEPPPFTTSINKLQNFLTTVQHNSYLTTKKFTTTLTPTTKSPTLTYTTKLFNITEVFPTLILQVKKNTLEPLVNFEKKDNRFTLPDRIHSPAPPDIHPPAENIDLSNTVLPPGVGPEPPGFSTESQNFGTVIMPNLRNTSNCCKY